MSNINRLLEARARLDERIDEVLSRPAEPEAIDGTNVVWFQVSYPTSPVTYTYAAVQVKGKWFLSGATSTVGRAWDELWDWLDTKNAKVVSMWHATEWVQL